jgi:serine protease Do
MTGNSEPHINANQPAPRTVKPCRSPLRRLALAGVVLGSTVGGYMLGNGLVLDAQYARAQEGVNAARTRLNNLGDLAGVYKDVNRVVEPAVVSVRVQRTIHNAAGNGRLNDEFLRRFFPDRDGDGEPDVPPGLQGPGGPNGPDGGDQLEQGQGSGVVVDYAEGYAYVVTNNHVAGNADKLVVTFSDGRETEEVKVLGTDPKSDLAVLRVKMDRVIPAKWGNSDSLEKGDIIMAFGAPFGFVGSMTHGIVSAKNRQAGIIGSEFAYEDFIQVDAPINPGNSGGPLVNLQGEIVGINTAIASRTGAFSGIGLAIPSNQVKGVYDQIRANGKVVRGWLGVSIGDVKENDRTRQMAKSVGYTGDNGVLVAGTVRGTPAFGRLQAGDIITGIDGKPVETSRDLRNRIAAISPGTEVTLNVFRNGDKTDVKVKLGEQPEDTTRVARGDDNANPAAPATTESLGVTLADVEPAALRRLGLPEDASGAVVRQVRPGSPAAQAGVRVGDLIQQVGGRAVASAAEAAAALEKADVSKGLSLNVANREGQRMLFLQQAGKR